MATSTIIEEPAVSTTSGAPADLVSAIGFHAKEAFETHDESASVALQNQLDALTAKVTALAFELFKEETDDLLRLLRNAYGQVARFVEGDFREIPGFYLGQLHALSELAYRLGHQRVPRELFELAARSNTVSQILAIVAQEKSIGAAELAGRLGMEESNLSATCKSLVEKELLRRERFGRRVRYSPTPITHSVLAQLNSNVPASQEVHAPAKASSSVGSAATPDWARTAVAAAANSLEPGYHVMANIDDFLSPLLTLGGVHGCDVIVIDPSSRRVRLEAKATGEHKDLELPASVSGPLAEQVNAYVNLKRTEPSGIVGGVVDWKGQKLSLASEDLQKGKMFTVQFLDNPNPNQWKSKVKTAFQEIHQEKIRLTDFEKIYVEEVLDSCQHKPSRAADTLGISRGKLNTLMKDLEIEL